MFAFLHYSFIVHGLTAGIIVAFIAPVIGIFLVLRRYSLIADTLSHVSLAGIAFGLLAGIQPIFTALVATVLSSIGIEYLRTTKKIYGESALSLFLSGSLALAVVLLSFAHGFKTSLFSYLFGSIATVTVSEVWTIAILAAVVICFIILLYKELVAVSFDEASAQVSGIPTRLINLLLIVASAITVSLAIPVVGVLLISALIVIPVITALQLKKSFLATILYAQLISVFSVIAGMIASFYFDIAPSGSIVLVMLAVFLVVFAVKQR